MVLMNGSSRARNAASIINRTNTDGGVKKAGIASTIGHPANLYWIYSKQLACINLCPFKISSTRVCGGQSQSAGGIRIYRC
jgi:hypothetical protein